MAYCIFHDLRVDGQDMFITVYTVYLSHVDISIDGNSIEFY